jgi:hypothetical protein
MRKVVTSHRTFKTSYIAAVKEELGLLKRKIKPTRKIKPPKHLKWAIVEALKRKPEGTYREIQELALKIYKAKKEEKLPFLGALGKVDTKLLKEVIEDKETIYED